MLSSAGLFRSNGASDGTTCDHRLRGTVRGATTVDPASTCLRLQRFFQHVRLEEDWAAPLLAGVAGGAEKRTLIIDRTNWKVGEANINLFVLAVIPAALLVDRTASRPG